MKKYNILLVSYLFSPDNAIGSVRPTKIAKYLIEFGYSVSVITANNFQKKNNDKIYEKVDSLFILEHSNFYKRFFIKEKKTSEYRGIESQKKNNSHSVYKNKTNKKKYLRNLLSKIYRELLLLVMNIDIYRSFKIFYRKNREKFSSYDSVISTYGPLSSHLMAKKIKKNSLCTWLADFRDPMYNEDTVAIFKYLYRKIQDKIISCSDIVTCVSEGYLKRVFTNKKDIIKGSVIYNGFDPSEKVKKENNNPNEFSFVYTGALYEGKRSFKIFFELITDLKMDYPDIIKDFRLYYLGKGFIFLKKEADMFSLGNNVVNVGYLPRETALEFQSKMRNLILLSWETEKDIGVIPGKVYEMMNTSKVIYTFIEGNVFNSELSKIIRNTKLGYVIERANYNEDYLEMIIRPLKTDCRII